MHVEKRGRGVRVTLSTREARSVGIFVEYASREGLDFISGDGDELRYLRRGNECTGRGKDRRAPVAHEMAEAILHITNPEWW